MKASRSYAALLAGIVFIGFAATNASAATIQGEFGFIGNYEIIGGGSLDAATGLTFPDPGRVIDAVSDFGPQNGADVFLNDFSFATRGNGAPILTTSNGLSFTLTGPIVINEQTASALDLTLTGYYSLAGFDDTAGTLTWTGDSLGGLLTYSATGATVIPLPGALVLFGSALGFLGLRRRTIG